jgi:hypothetical protein
MKHFDRPHRGDVFLNERAHRLLQSSVMRFRRLQGFVGHGHFHLLGFDEAIRISKGSAQVGAFTKAEKNFLEMIYYENASVYGFYGRKPLQDITDHIKKQAVTKIRRSGNYLFRGPPLETYLKIKKEIGGRAVLTSGIRSVTKQFFLFLNKAHRTNGNLSMASRSLAPPGYSYHGIGDFDMGQVGFGAANFTIRFTKTEVFKRLQDLGYVSLRYPDGNLLGVRFEPWHIKVPNMA